MKGSRGQGVKGLVERSPVDLFGAHLLEEGVCLGEVFAAEESVVGAEGRRVRGLEHQVFALVQHLGLLLCEGSPQDEHDVVPLLVQQVNHLVLREREREERNNKEGW